MSDRARNRVLRRTGALHAVRLQIETDGQAVNASEAAPNAVLASHQAHRHPRPPNMRNMTAKRARTVPQT
jgi:hypothetical protein